jgi:hypothetical protein
MIADIERDFAAPIEEVLDEANSSRRDQALEPCGFRQQLAASDRQPTQ